MKTTVEIPIKCFWVSTRSDDDLNKEFSAHQIKEALLYLNQQRDLWPQKNIDMLAWLDF